MKDIIKPNTNVPNKLRVLLLVLALITNKKLKRYGIKKLLVKVYNQTLVFPL